MNDLNEFESTAFEKLFKLDKELSSRLIKLIHDRSRSHSADYSEQAVERENDEVIDQLENDTRTELAQVKKAMKRIHNEEYTVCTICGGEISEKRLNAIPYTTICIECTN